MRLSAEFAMELCVDAVAKILGQRLEEHCAEDVADAGEENVQPGRAPSDLCRVAVLDKRKRKPAHVGNRVRAPEASERKERKCQRPELVDHRPALLGGVRRGRNEPVG
eukprot:Amastigsp_a177469_16.p4 type:complete len:108 gc:universal Amastigsp_a177469_16:551-874(+)